MTWTRLDDDHGDRPELLEVSRSGRLLLIELMIWGNRMLTDGRVPLAGLGRITDSSDPVAELHQLEAAGWVEFAADGNSIQINWSTQETAEAVLSRRASRAEKQKRYRQHQVGDHSLCLEKSCRFVTRNATRNESSNEVGNVTGLVTPSPPDPARPGPKEPGRGQEQVPCSKPGHKESGGTTARCIPCITESRAAS